MNTPSLWRDAAPLVLASGSRARRALLEAAAIPLEITRPQVDEAALAAGLVEKGATPAAIAAALAEAKGLEAARHLPARLILAADQTLDLDGALGMKAPDLPAARRQLQVMSGRAHKLHSAAVLVRDGAVLWRGTETASLTMRPLSEAFLDTYLALMGARVLETVGCYELEAMGPHLFARIEGAPATILGLPLTSLFEALRGQGKLLA